MSVLLKDPAFKIFAELLKKSQLDFDLGNKDSSFTVFCPTSHAIMKKLHEQVSCHVPLCPMRTPFFTRIIMTANSVI